MAQSKNDEMWERLHEYFNVEEEYSGLEALQKRDEILYERTPPLAQSPPAPYAWKEFVKDDGTKYYKVTYKNPADFSDYPTTINPPGSANDVAAALAAEEQEFENSQDALNIPAADDSEEFSGATHYVSIPPDSNLSAILRAGYISSNQKAEKIKNIDLYENGIYLLDQQLFVNSGYSNKGHAAGHPLKYLTDKTPVRVIKEGFGPAAIFSRVAVYDEENEKWQYTEEDNPAFIDTRVLKRFASYSDRMTELDSNLLTEVYEGLSATMLASLDVDSIFSNMEVPMVAVDDPDPNFVEPDWTAKKTCDFFLNKKTREYYVTIELWGDIDKEQARVEAIDFLLEYYGKNFNFLLIERLKYLGGSNYSNFEEDPTEGLFAVCKEVSASNRDDGMVKYLIAIPETYFNHPSFDVELTNTMTREEYFATNLVTKTFYVENKEINNRINTLVQDLQEFKTRINNYDGTITFESEDIDKKIERLNSFYTNMTNFLELNDEDINDEGVIEFGLNDLFRPIYVNYTKNKNKESRFLRNGLNCIWHKNQTFADDTARAYLFYAKQIREAIKNNKYSGIELVQKFTYPIPENLPSKKKSDNPAKNLSDQTIDQKQLMKKSTKTKEEVQTKNILLGDPEEIQKKAMKASLEQFFPGDDIFANFSNLLDSVDNITQLFDMILNKVPLFNLLAKAALCLMHKLNIDDLLETITNTFLSMFNAIEMIMLLTNKFLGDLMEERCPGASLKIQNIITNAFDSVMMNTNAALAAEERESMSKILDEIVNSRFDDRDIDFTGKDIDFDSSKILNVLGGVLQNIIREIKSEGLLTCLLESVCEAIKQTNEVESTIGGAEKFYDTYKADSVSVEAELIGEAKGTFSPEEAAEASSKMVPGMKGFLNLIEMIPFLRSVNCEVLVMILETKVLGTVTEDEIIKKNMEQIGVRFPEIDYSDDPMAFLDTAVMKEIMKVLNEVLTPIIKVILEELGLLCQAMSIDTPLENTPDSEPNYDELDPDMFENPDNIFDLAEDALNLPGSGNILGNLNPSDRANLDGILADIMPELDGSSRNPMGPGGMPITPKTIGALKDLLDVLSNVLRPTEICTLLSGNASEVTLQIILNLIQKRPEFSLIADYLNNTDSIAKLFRLFGQYANQFYCKSAVEDITLISVLCETELNEQLYWDVLKKKGFSPEESKRITDKNKDRDIAKLAILEEMLSAPSLSDYFQDKSGLGEGEEPCAAQTPDQLAYNNSFMDGIIDLALNNIIGAVKGSFAADARGIKSVLIKEKITPYAGDFPRAPEFGRDYLNQDIPTGSLGTPLYPRLFFMTSYLLGDGAALFDDDQKAKMLPEKSQKKWEEYQAGEQIFDNWPKVDKVERHVAPGFIQDSKIVRDIGSIGIVLNEEKDFENTRKFVVSIREIDEKVQGQIQLQRQRINEMAKLRPSDDAYKNAEGDLHGKGHGGGAIAQSLQIRAMAALGELTIEKNLVEYKLPRYSYFSSDEAIKKGLSVDYNSFTVRKLPIKKKGRLARPKNINIDVYETTPDEETLEKIQLLVDQPDLTAVEPLTIEDDPNMTLQEYCFAKIISLSLVPETVKLSSISNESKMIRKELETKYAELFPYILANKQNEIIKECLKSRFFTAANLDKLISSPLTPQAIEALECSDNPSINLDSLRKGLLDLDEIKKETKDFYDDIACETNSRGAEDPAPLNDAIRYGMVLISIRLIVAELVFRSLFFFSRYSAEKTIRNSGVFLAIASRKLRDEATSSKLNPSFFVEIKKITRKKLNNMIRSQGHVQLLSNKIINDSSQDIDTREFTDFNKKIFNIADLNELIRFSKKGINPEEDPVISELYDTFKIFLSEDEQDMIELAEEDNDWSNALAPIIGKLQSKFDDLAIKYVINDTASKMIPKIDEIFLDKDRINVDTTKTLLSSETIFDIPSNMYTVEQAIEYQGGFENFDALYEHVNDTVGTAGGHWVGLARNLFLEYERPPDNVFNPPLYKPKNEQQYRPVDIINYSFEKNHRDIGHTPNFQNICLDAWDTADKFFAQSTKSTFYDRDGNMTELGRATKNGGFIVQKYVTVQVRPLSTYESEENNSGAPWSIITSLFNPVDGRYHFIKTFIEHVTKKEHPEITTHPRTYNISYKQFDWAIREASDFDDKNILDGTTNFPLNDVFIKISHKVRLCFVPGHNIKNILPGASPEAASNYTFEVDNRMQMLTTVPVKQYGPYSDERKQLYGIPGQLEDLFLLEENNTDGWSRAIRDNKIYQIKEPVRRHGGEFSYESDAAEIFYNDISLGGSGQQESATDLGLRKASEKIIGNFYIIPITEAFVEENIDSLLDATRIEVSNILTKTTYGTLDFGGIVPDIQIQSPDTLSIAKMTPIVEQYGANANKLIPQLMEKPYVKILNDYIFSSTNLLNFAVLQQSYFPYSRKFDFDGLFDNSRRIINQIFEANDETRDDWSSLMSDEILSGWGKDMDTVMSAQNFDGAFFQWLAEVIPKFLLRYAIASTDPCMADAFEQQDENDWDDTKLPEIVFGSLFTKPANCAKEFDEIVDSIPGLSFALDLLGISVPGDKTEERECLPGIRPTPIFPTVFPFYGDATRPITPPGLIYTMLQFLTGFDNKYKSDQEGATEDGDICGPDSNLNQSAGLITQETQSTPEE